MKRLLAVALMTVVGSTIMYAADAKETERMDSAANVLNELAQTPDKGIPDEIAAAAKCVAVVPSLKKGAFGFGGEYGQGVVSCRTSNGWSAPAPIRMTGGSWGLQIGGQSADVVMLAMNDKGMQDLLSSKFKIGGDASAAAGPVGRHASAATNWKLDSELLTYSRAKGLFAGISLTGTDVSQNDDGTAALYGQAESFRDILSGKVEAPAGSAKFEHALRSYFDRAATHEANENK